jgi:hypothetical protein
MGQCQQRLSTSTAAVSWVEEGAVHLVQCRYRLYSLKAVVFALGKYTAADQDGLRSCLAVPSSLSPPSAVFSCFIINPLSPRTNGVGEEGEGELIFGGRQSRKLAL